MDHIPAVLIVEDNDRDRFLFKHAMEKLKVANPMHFVVDGQQAIEYLDGRGEYADREKHPVPMLVLLDYHMPKVNGAEVLRWMRNDERFRKIAVVMMTSTISEWELKRATDAGADSYLVKPGDLAGIMRIIQELPLGWAFMEAKTP